MKIGIDIRVLLDRQYSGVANFAFHLIKNIIKIDRRNAYYFFYNSFRRKIDPSFLPEGQEGLINLQSQAGESLNFKSEESLNFKQEESLSSEKKQASDLSLSYKIIKTSYPNKIFNYFFQSIFSWPKLDKVLGGTDVFYSPHINFSSFSSGTKSIITIHDLSFLRYPEFFSRRKNIWHRSLRIRKKIQKFDKIIAVSENTKNDLIELLNIPEEKIELIYSGLPEDIMQSSQKYPNDYLKTKFNIDKKFILYLGTIEPRKNISTLIKAYNQIRDEGEDLLLVLAGAWGWKTKEIKREWQASKYKNDIYFISYVENDLKPLLYQKAELFVYPSFYEGFGFPPLEAMYFSLPVLASNVSSLPEVLGEAAFFFNPHKSGELAGAIKLCLHDQALREKMICRGREQVDKFNWSQTAQKYLAVFQDCLGEANLKNDK